MDLFAWLDGASGWWWIALALGFGALELLTFGYFMLWLGCAAASVGLIVFAASPGGVWQITFFAVLAIVYSVAGYWLLPRGRGTPSVTGLNERSARLIGRQAVVRQAFSAGIGAVEIDGVRWRARLSPGTAAPDEGKIVAVTGAEGMTLVVGPPV